MFSRRNKFSRGSMILIINEKEQNCLEFHNALSPPFLVRCLCYDDVTVQNLKSPEPSIIILVSNDICEKRISVLCTIRDSVPKAQIVLYGLQSSAPLPEELQGLTIVRALDFESLLAILSSSESNNVDWKSLVLPDAKFILNNIRNIHRVSDISTARYVKSRRYADEFTLWIGKAPQEYIHFHRFELIKGELSKHNPQDVKYFSVAYDCGYTSLSGLESFVSRHTGMSLADFHTSFFGPP